AGLALGLGIYEHLRVQKEADHAAALVRQVLDANLTQAPAIINEMEPYRAWTDPLLQEALHQAKESGDGRRQFHASLALLPVDREQFDYLYQRLLASSPEEAPVLADALWKCGQDELVGRLRRVLDHAGENPGECLPAACALAFLDGVGAIPDSAFP